jgi:predicted nuclease of predicted toxin-antitoxin system
VTGKPTIYFDDCADDKLLESLLTQTGYTVVTLRSAGTKGWRDPDHLDYAAQHGYTLLTSNPADFVALHQQWQAQGRAHAGILLVYYDNIGAKDMKPHDIVRAVENLIASGLPIVDEVYNLNHWR